MPGRSNTHVAVSFRCLPLPSNVGNPSKLTPHPPSSGFTKQLPTVICFYKGRELRRLPQFTTGGKVIDNIMAEQTLIKHFGE